MLKPCFYSLFFFLFINLNLINAQSTQLKFLQFNIWQEGTVVNGGFEAIVDEILANNADIITFSEVRNYKNVPFNEKIILALQKKDANYYSFLSYDSGILSKFPIESYQEVYPLKNDHGSAYKAIIKVNNNRIIAYTAHLDYLNAANYPPRGYDANTWKKLGEKSADVNEILRINADSQRDEAINLIIKDAEIESKNGGIVILGMDLNEPSHRDWKKNTKDLYDHNGLIIPWQNTMSLEKNGWIDAYRKIYPNVLTHPGFTFPAFNPHVPINKLIWAKEADERDRIDFIFYKKHKNIRLNSISILGPNTSISNGNVIKELTKDPFVLPKGIWPTDHKAILATFTIK